MKKAFLKIWKCRGLRIMIIIILSVAWIWTVFAIIPPAKAMADNPFIVDKGKGPMIAAHRGGKNSIPKTPFSPLMMRLIGFTLKCWNWI